MQVTRLALMNSKLSQSLSLHNLATNLDSDEDNSAASTPQPASPSQSSLVINLNNAGLDDLDTNIYLINLHQQIYPHIKTDRMYFQALNLRHFSASCLSLQRTTSDQ